MTAATASFNYGADDVFKYVTRSSCSFGSGFRRMADEAAALRAICHHFSDLERRCTTEEQRCRSVHTDSVSVPVCLTSRTAPDSHWQSLRRYRHRHRFLDLRRQHHGKPRQQDCKLYSCQVFRAILSDWALPICTLCHSAAACLRALRLSLLIGALPGPSMRMAGDFIATVQGSLDKMVAVTVPRPRLLDGASQSSRACWIKPPMHGALETF